ncbi:hypothetical protein [Gardnerella sp. Marseille-Q2328]|nr:hypothetical protein [Gardnerella sp. Marseille-Q2328]
MVSITISSTKPTAFIPPQWAFLLLSRIRHDIAALVRTDSILTDSIPTD